MKHVIIFLFLFLFLFSAKAWEKRDLLQKEASIESLKSSLLLNSAWIKYPNYYDRKGWDALTAENKAEIIEQGEKMLDYQWKVVKATDYLEYERSGSRRIMEDPFGDNNNALSRLVLAELAEGKGRFMDQIANGIWHACEMTSWALSAHISREQKEKTSLPSYKEHIIDLTAGDLGSFLSWTYYFLKDELNKVQPLISERLLKNLQDRILKPYMNRTFWWTASNANAETMVNNWNPWCNFNVLTCFLLLENNPDQLAAAVYRTMISVDQFINYNHEDGACEEGPSYWGHAAGKMYDYLQLLSNATGEKVNIFDQPMIKNMGEYIARSYIGNGWVVNFADASAKGGGEQGLVFRFGQAVKSTDMQQFAAYLYERDQKKSEYNAGRDMFRTLENLRSFNELKGTSPLFPQFAASWYPQTEFCYLRNKSGFFFAAKGGYNAESHNHNDMGSFILYLDETPMLIDAGVGTYTRQTFSSERYSIWTMQSNYHNLPLINGVPQSFGRKYHSSSVSFNEKNASFSLDLAKAYPEEAAVHSYLRKYQLTENGLVISDSFILNEIKSANQLNFLCWAKPEEAGVGKIRIEKNGKQVMLTYDPKQFEPSVKTIPQPDKRLSNVWGENLFRITLTAKKQLLRDTYRISIQN